MATTEIVRKAGRPSAEAAQKIYDDILNAAYRAFVDQGFAEATVDGIATMAQTTRRSVVHRFPTKDDLLIAVADRKLKDMLAATAIREDELTENLLDTLHSALRRLLTLFLEPDMLGYCRMSMNETQRLPIIGKLSIEWNEAVVESYVRLILKAQKAGHFRRFSARTMADMAIGVMLSNPFNRALLGDPGFQDPHKIDVYFSEMWAIFVAMA
jgi:AcrR family transcriptional regulator